MKFTIFKRIVMVTNPFFLNYNQSTTKSKL